jgi:hypothetical protein
MDKVYHYAYKYDRDDIKLLLSKAPYKYLNPSFRGACARKDSSVFYVLEQTFADGGITHIINCVPIACKYGNVDIYRHMVKKYEPNVVYHLAALEGACQSKRNRSPNAATREDQMKIIDEIIVNICKFSISNAAKYNIGLIGAAKGCNLDIVKKMIALGADDYDGAISAAMKECRTNVVEFLIEYKNRSIKQ